jgi:hypothetical protein
MKRQLVSEEFQQLTTKPKKCLPNRWRSEDEVMLNSGRKKDPRRKKVTNPETETTL